MASDTCILITSHNRYDSLARLTQSEIARQWYRHPPVFLSGLTGSGSDILPLQRKSVDWIGIALDAVEKLLSCNYRSAYLILDDHPPVGRCQSELLNNVLPRLLIDLNAVNISLFGSGQGRKVEGAICVSDTIGLEKLPESYLWRYSLHPGLWSLVALRELLLILDGKLASVEKRTAWSFECLGAENKKVVIRNEARSSYRLTRPLSINVGVDSRLDGLYRGVGNVTRSVAGRVADANAWNHMSGCFDFCYHYYAGSYPIFWRGVMEKGRINVEFIRFFGYFLKRRLLREITHIATLKHF